MIRKTVTSSSMRPLSLLNSHNVTPKYPNTLTEQVPNKLICDNPNINKLIETIGNEECSIKQMMERLQLRHRPNFIDLYLNPAIVVVRMLYPDSPRHPRQRYLLTVKGIALYNAIR